MYAGVDTAGGEEGMMSTRIYRVIVRGFVEARMPSHAAAVSKREGYLAQGPQHVGALADEECWIEIEAESREIPRRRQR